jgi:hypothetical protein
MGTGNRTALIYFLEPEPEVLYESQEPPNTASNKHKQRQNQLGQCP